MIYSIVAAPSATPTNLEVASTTPTSITITWVSVQCEDRNLEITHYAGRYGSHRNLPIYILVSLPWHSLPVAAIRQFNATGLVPRTNYTFEVEAAHINPATFDFFRGPSATVTGTTAVSTGTHNLL